MIASYSLKTICGTKEEIPYDQPVGPDDEIMQRRVDRK
jgi:hypothetical protein